MTSQSQTSIQSSTDFSSHPDDDSHPTKFLSMSEKTPLSKLSPSPLTTALLPPPVTDDSSSPTKRSKSKKNARVTTDLRLHWEKFRRRFAAASAPSTSSQIDDSTSESNTLSKSTQPNPTPLDDPDDLLDEVIVDRVARPRARMSQRRGYGASAFGRAGSTRSTSCTIEMLLGPPNGRTPLTSS